MYLALHFTHEISLAPRTRLHAPLTGKTLFPYVDIVRVYDTKSADGVDWNMIDPDQWVEAGGLAIVTPNTTPPEGVTTGRRIDINRAEQALVVYDNSQSLHRPILRPIMTGHIDIG